MLAQFWRRFHNGGIAAFRPIFAAYRLLQRLSGNAPMKPSEIVAQLNRHVIGQDDAKKILAVAVYAHFRKVAMTDVDRLEMLKSNILLIGPTGTGKTLLCETLARVLELPFVTADATSLAQTEYVNEELDAILQRLLERAGGDPAKAGRGIVFIDEVDKLKAISGQARAASGENVQHALLKIMEGSLVSLKSGQTIDTKQILFICGGAFVGLESILAETQAFGFIATSQSDDQKVLDRLNARVKPTDLFRFGLIPEFAGRLPVIARLKELSKDMMVRIMIEPQHSIYRQFRAILQNEGVELVIEPMVFGQIADLAFEFKVGARSLRGLFEEMITPVLYVVPDRPEVKKVTIRSLFEEAVFS
jgi:ATP-dependent Clp protease ATP-binding subunit ClpX